MVIPVCRIAANPSDLEQTAVYCLVKQPYSNLIFCGKCFFFRNMAFFVQLCKIFPEPFLRKVKFTVHKAVPVVPRKSREYAGLAVFRFAQAAAVLALHPGGMFPFFHKTRIIYGQHTRGLPNLFGKQFLVNIQERLFLKRGA